MRGAKASAQHGLLLLLATIVALPVPHANLSCVQPESLHEHVERLFRLLLEAVQHIYGDRLVSVVVFGSMARGTPRADSDLDVLIIAEPLPRGRVARLADIGRVERALEPYFQDARRAGFATECSPVFKTPGEALTGSPLFLDMVEDAKILFDRDGFFAAAMARLRERLTALGARRVWRGNAWYWDLKPDYRPGEVFEL